MPVVDARDRPLVAPGVLKGVQPTWFPVGLAQPEPANLASQFTGILPYRRSMMVALAMPPPSHMHCKP
jgi:hypothetical protein